MLMFTMSDNQSKITRHINILHNIHQHKKTYMWGTWVTQSVKGELLILISQFEGLSLTSDSTLTA